MLKTQHKILTYGTVHSNWKGWDLCQMNLLKNSNSDTLKVFYDKVNGILFGQLNDYKVVYFISTLLLVGEGVASRQCEKENLVCPCPNALISYNQYIRYLDLVDFGEKLEGDLSEWYKLGILDFILVDDRVA